MRESLDSDSEELFEDIYNYYATPSAWTVPPGLRTALTRIHDAGVTICVVSNFDQRLRSILQVNPHPRYHNHRCPSRQPPLVAFGSVHLPATVGPHKLQFLGA